jgi:hypothetical protein
MSVHINAHTRLYTIFELHLIFVSILILIHQYHSNAIVNNISIAL